MKHAIACKIQGEHGVLVSAPKVHAQGFAITPGIYREGKLLLLSGSMPALLVLATMGDGNPVTAASVRLATVFSLS